MGGKPSKGTKRDRRLKRNRGKAVRARRKRALGKGNQGDGRFPV